MKIFVIYLKILLFLGNHRTIAKAVKSMKQLKDTLLRQEKGHLYHLSGIACFTYTDFLK